MRSHSSRLTALRPGRGTLLWGALLVNSELLLVFAYLATASATVTEPLYLLVPFVWLNAAAWAAIRTPYPTPESGRTRLLVAGVGVGYFLLLGYVGGLYMFGGGGTELAFRTTLPPGWGPVVHAAAGGLMVTLVPYKLAGYAALSYLVAARVADVSGSALSGLLGLFSCVSCTWPLLGTVAAGALGSGSAVAAFATNQPYLASTAVFLSAVALLTWRPGETGGLISR